MPVGTICLSEMVCYSGFHSPGAEGAANINIEAGFELQGSKLTDFNLGFETGRENQYICAGLRVHHIKIKRLIKKPSALSAI